MEMQLASSRKVTMPFEAFTVEHIKCPDVKAMVAIWHYTILPVSEVKMMNFSADISPTKTAGNQQCYPQQQHEILTRIGIRKGIAVQQVEGAQQRASAMAEKQWR